MVEPGSSTTTRLRESSAIHLRDVEMRFGATRALRDVSFAVPAGSLCGLVGPNGAGKTTTMRIVVTDLAPTEGEVTVLRRELPREAEAIRPRIGYMPDSAGLYEELSLREYLDFFASFYGLGKAARPAAVAAAMELAGVTRFADRRLTGLSKGERQRVALSRTLINDPELMVLDEPADGLDPRGRVELREMLKLLNERGKTILVSSHILADLEEICTDLVFIDRGKVLYQGSRARLLEGGLQAARVSIETMDGSERLGAVLTGFPEARVDEELERGLVVSLPADPAVACRLLRELVEAGVPVTSFARSTESLEDVYMRLTDEDRPS
ncbi:MAG: ABC transporter ATP-binding protein [Thermoanaerobaculia bacterium]